MPNKRKRGQATVELALIITLLVLLLIGVADVARIYGEQLAVVHAAGVGARWSSLPMATRQMSYSDLCDVVTADLSDDLPSGVTINVRSESGAVNDAVKVTITYRHAFLFGLFKPGGMFVTLPSSYTTSATMPVAQGVSPPADRNSLCTLP